jgi:hypothetical protein
LDIYRADIEQLRREAAMERMPVSQTIAEMIQYIQEHEKEDSLVSGFPNKKDNPFKTSSICSIL